MIQEKILTDELDEQDKNPLNNRECGENKKKNFLSFFAGFAPLR